MRIVLTQAGSSIESYSGLHPAKKESLKVFFLVLQVCHLLMAGQVGFILSYKVHNLLVKSCCAFSKHSEISMNDAPRLSAHVLEVFIIFER